MQIESLQRLQSLEDAVKENTKTTKSIRLPGGSVGTGGGHGWTGEHPPSGCCNPGKSECGAPGKVQ